MGSKERGKLEFHVFTLLGLSGLIPSDVLMESWLQKWNILIVMVMTNFPFHFDFPPLKCSPWIKLLWVCPWVYLECSKETGRGHIWFGVEGWMSWFHRQYHVHPSHWELHLWKNGSQKQSWIPSAGFLQCPWKARDLTISTALAGKTCG